MTEERRRFVRVTFKVEAELLIKDAKYRAAEISNLSLGGCFLPIKERLDPGMGCEVQIVMAGASSELVVRVHGEVVRTSDIGIAVKFMHIDPDSLLHLQNIIRYNTSSSEKVAKEFQFRRGLF